MFIPELILRNLVAGIFSHILTDYSKRDVKEESMLYRIVGGQRLDQDRPLFNEALSILTRKKENERSIKVVLGFSRQQLAPITVAIASPSEMPAYTTIGAEDPGAGFSNRDGSFTSANQSGFSAEYGVFITADNYTELLIVYNILKFCLVGASSTLALSGFNNLTISGKDVLLDPETNRVPQNIYTKAIFLNSLTEIAAPLLFDQQQVNDIILAGCAVEQISTTDG